MTQLDLTFEQDKKNRGMKLSAAKNQEYLDRARDLAREIGERTGTCSIEDVRMLAVSRGVFLPPANYLGSVFRDGNWLPAGWVTSYHKGSHGRPVRLWRLK